MAVAYSYIRFSTPEQSKGDSLRRQLEISAKWAEDNGYDMRDPILDLGVPAFHGKNRFEGALAAFIERVEAGVVAPGTALVVEAFDRISREDVLTALELFLRLIRRGIVVVTLVDRQVYSQERLKTDSTPLFISIAAMLRAHEESSTKAKRVAAAWGKKRERARQSGEPLTRILPSWLSLRERKIEAIPDRAAIVRRIFEEAASGLGKRLIAQRLNEEGVPTWRRGNGWQPSYIAKILSNRAVIGEYQPMRKVAGKREMEGEAIPAYFPAIIDEGLFWRAAAAIASRRRTGGPRGRRFPNILPGLVRCGKCGGPMHFVDKGPPPKGNQYFVCDRARRGYGCKGRRHYVYDHVEKGVLGNLDKERIAEIVDAESAEVRILRQELEKNAGDLVRVNDLVTRLLSRFESGADAVGDRIQSLQRDFAALKSQRDDLQRRLASASSANSDHDLLDKLIAQLGAAESTPTGFEYRAELSQWMRRFVVRVRISGDVGFVLFRSGRLGLILF